MSEPIFIAIITGIATITAATAPPLIAHITSKKKNYRSRSNKR